ncbi:4902_t:CDS:2, partial [Ambispora gerdemannii]
MGAINKSMKGISFSTGQEYLKEFRCCQCHLFLDEQDIEKENYSFEFSDYANDITKDYNQGVNHIEYECPDWERCQGCYSHFRIKEVKKLDNENGYYYCPPCYQQITGKEFQE